jgi:hypothetical protein
MPNRFGRAQALQHHQTALLPTTGAADIIAPNVSSGSERINAVISIPGPKYPSVTSVFQEALEISVLCAAPGGLLRLPVLLGIACSAWPPIGGLLHIHIVLILPLLLRKNDV